MIPVHAIFDLLAVALSVTTGGLIYLWRLRDSLQKTAASVGQGYFTALGLGSVIGSYVLGTGNLWLSGEPIIGRSILGALCGAILSVEIYKAFKGTRGSTGYLFVIPFCILIAVGRLGCFFSGLEDQTYGTPTSLPWGADFGDGIMRHPVQLYESLSMALFAAFAFLMLKIRRSLIVDYGFYLCAGFYAAQRFLWEFLKPYAAIIGGLNLFQIACLLLLGYSFVMIMRVKNGYRST